MACLTLQETAEVMKIGKVPVDVCCASLNYFLKTSQPSYYQRIIYHTNDELVCIILTSSFET